MASVPVTRNRRPGACWLKLPERCERTPLAWVSATNTSSSSPVSRSEFAVHGLYWPEQYERLVDEVTPEVEQHAATGRPWAPVGVALEAGLEWRTAPSSPSCINFRTVRKSESQRRFWNGTTIDPLAVRLHGVGRGAGVEREGFVADHGEAELERGVGEVGVRRSWSRDGDGLGAGIDELAQVVEHVDVLVIGAHQCAALVGRRHNTDERALRRRSEERRVEPATSEPVSDEADADRLDFDHDAHPSIGK